MPSNNLIVDDIASIDFENQYFVLSGEFEHGEKKDITNLIVNKGGNCSDKINSKTNYLIVGGKGSKAWIHGEGGGTKVEKALEMKAKGKDIKIITEEKFFEIISD